MPGYELLGKEEYKEISQIFKKSKTLFRMGFDNIRKNIFKVEDFENKFAKKLNSSYALAVSSGTAALRTSLAAIDLNPGDEVITQSFTFVATVEAIVEARAIPVCTEIDETLNMDPKDLIKKINNKTKAVIVVHMLGVPARIYEIKKICKKYKLILIEDTAWGCGAQYKKKFLGTWGDIGAFSFDFAKTITTGEGGMLLFKSKKKYLKAKAWHDQGHENNPNVPRWEDTRKSSGFNFRMTEMQGAVGLAQLKKLDYIIKKQRENHNKIWDNIKNLNILKRAYPKKSKISADALIIFVKNSNVAKKCRKELLKFGISTKILPEAYTWHFAAQWSHIKSLKVKNKKSLNNSFPKSKKLLSRCVSIPIFVKMKKEIPENIYKALQRSLQ